MKNVCFVVVEAGGLPVGAAVAYPADAEQNDILQQYNQIPANNPYYLDEFFIQKEYHEKGLGTQSIKK